MAKAKPKATQPKAAKSNVKKIDLSALFTPLDDRILVQFISADRITAGGLFIPDTATVDGNKKAIVVSVGRGHLDTKGRVRPIDVKVGDQILVGEYAGSKIQVGEHSLTIVRESDVLGIIEN